MYSESDARKTRSLSICLLMVLSVLGPLASADHDSHVGMNTTLFIDGIEYEMEEVPFWGSLDTCTENSDGNFECEMDTDGDGNNDGYYYFEDCDDSSGSWECVYAEVQPLIDEGNYSLLFEVYNLEADTNFSVSINVYTDSIYGGWSQNWNHYFDSDSTGQLNASGAYLDIQSEACSGYASIQVHYAANGSYMGSKYFWFDGPCDADSHMTLEYDGEEWEQEPQFQDWGTILDCDEYGASWFCTMDYNDDGYADGMSEFLDCELLSDGSWECVYSYHDPLIQPGNHTMTIDASGLDANESYVIMVDPQVCDMWNCYYPDESEILFNGSIGSGTFYLETDDYTCNANLHISIRTVQWDSSGQWYWYDQIESRNFRFSGPCEQPPSPFTLTVDGVEHEVTIHWNDYDNCEDDGNHFDCWNDDWDYDGDGEPDWFDHQNNCQEDAANSTWYCEGWHENPYITEGNHTMQLDIDNLTTGYSYKLRMNYNHNWLGGYDYGEDEVFFNLSGTSTSWSETGNFETTNMTCNVNFDFTLWSGEWTSDGWFNTNQTVGQENMGYNGPCEQPPSPFTLTYDGVEWEEQWNYQTFDECEDMGDGYECWNDDWDNDGDGEPDWTNFYEECDELSDGWECAAWWSNPFIDAGNHTMELTIEDLEIGANYTVELDYDICQNMMGCDGDSCGFTFTATAETMSETFYLETDNQTCSVNIYVNLYEEMDGWNSHVAHDYFHFNGPCEQPPSPFTLTYDGVEWEEQWNYQTFDECEDMGDGYECWNDDWDNDGDGEPDWTNFYEECDELSDGSWECAAWWSNPFIDAGNHTMILTVEDLTSGLNYSLWVETEVCSQMGCEFSEIDTNFTATSDSEDITFYLATDEYTCNVNVFADVSENHDGSWTSFTDYFHFNGPCEQPPSPFTLTYDGVEWEEQWNYQTYDECEDMGDGYECWNDDWDNDGDGEPDWTDSYEVCDELSDGGWECQTWWTNPFIDAGNHTMELTIEDLEVGPTTPLSCTTTSART